VLDRPKDGIEQEDKALDAILSRLRDWPTVVVERMALEAITRLWTLARRVEDLFGLQRKMDVSLGIIEQRLRANADRLRRLEAEQQQVVTAAGAAATAAATSIASAVLSDAVPRVTRIKGWTEQLERRLPLPE
jgi:predicted component of type VI protein secretion system